jgi:hypothetical protein
MDFELVLRPPIEIARLTVQMKFVGKTSRLKTAYLAGACLLVNLVSPRQEKRTMHWPHEPTNPQKEEQIK